MTELAGGGTDTIESSVTLTLAANVENLTLTGVDAINGTGNELANTLTGNAGANTLTGGAGNDTLESSVTVTLAADVETLILTGTDAINGTGNALANTLTGNAGANTLTGGAGNDTLDGGADTVLDVLIGGAGDDIYIVRANDTVTEAANAGTDTVKTDLASFTLSRMSRISPSPEPATSSERATRSPTPSPAASAMTR